ncbi:uncharacterized protein LOC127868645 [Dreissena polymorpha]|uniref:Uncharacterized protein n=1 Tax=Dreissena polymorpha TaxID=45954 RepID=A0A9D4RLQ2_DREPO|nr:uncharacterized protein LOC127868645 [Dreissena polymorpha]KAH3872023.1 hypothetical protein DPMN_035236 [Dreissena polymorpha]
MYSVIPRPQVIDHRQEDGEPKPEILDHRSGRPTVSRWKDRRRAEQLPYDLLRQHRDALLNAEIKYKHHIKELEKQCEDITQDYDQTYKENKQLRSILEHGPDAAKMKQLKLDKKEQKTIIDQQQEEMKLLNDKIKELEKAAGGPRDYLVEKNWQNALDRVRRKREEEDAIPTQGPFVGTKLFKKRRIAIDDVRIADQDTYDLSLDSLEKETQVLLNKIRQLKREKEQIDYATMMGKGAVSRNTVIANAINEKLNRDLNKFAIRLEKLKLKHKAAKDYTRTITGNVKEPLDSEMMDPSPEIDIADTDGSAKTLRSYKSRPASKFMPDDSKPEKPPSETSNKQSDRAKSTQSKITTNTTNTEPYSFGNKSNHSKLSKKPKSLKRSSSAEDVRLTKPVHEPVYEKADTDREVRVENAAEVKHTLSKPKPDRSAETSVIQKERFAKNGTTDVSLTNGRYAHGPEPIKFRNRSFKYEEMPVRNNYSANQIPVNPVNAKIAFPFSKSNKHRIQSKSENHANEASYDAVLDYLNQQTGNVHRRVRYREAPTTYDDIERTISPIPIGFKTDVKVIDRRELRNIYANHTSVRRPEYFQAEQM